MSWGGGGGGGWGGGMGGGWAGGAQASGLPFAGIPEELQDGVNRVLVREPDWDPETVEFSHHDFERRPFTLRRFLLPYWPALLGSFLLVVIETAAMQAGPVLTQWGIDNGIVPRDEGAILLAGGVFLVAVVVNTVSAWGRMAWTGRVGERLMFDLRTHIFSHFQRLSPAFFTKEKAGVLMTRMTSDLESLQALFQEGMVQMIVQGLTMVFVTGMVFAYDATLATVMMVVVVPGMTVFTLWFKRASDRGYDDVRDRIADVLSHLQETLSGIRIVTAYNRQRHDYRVHRTVVGRYRDANDYTAKVSGLYAPGTEVIGIGGQALILAVGGNMVLSGDLSIGELAAFILAVNTFFAPIQQLVQLYDTFQKGQSSVRKLDTLLRTEPTVPERPDAMTLPPVRGEIRFEDVTFGYDPSRPVLRGVDLTIAPGETFSLVGATGAGKSTIAKLVTRFYDPLEGRVLLDGQDVRDLTLESLRGQLGIVPQEPFLFFGSIRDNIAFARPDATDDEVFEACEAVGIDELIARLPAGIHTPCHERGVSLSAGERQLLALARAFLAQPRVLVLDEATSNLDLRSEATIERALDVVLEGRTAIIIAHRLATAMRADRLAVVHDGRIAELGTHDELVEADGLYADMFRTWQHHAGGRRARVPVETGPQSGRGR